ncbi:substrate-binding periplasmic protein [Zooshikella harenae]|uniref:Transporter substrate-binding domain-containing protein n=1 Tax=Zooshikella harenae TaxID=2827238 RepID=A0ABS5ZJM3_9GAMM|nr:transporter substrate-binding domain-containing protein [Zooshikella harenae]MBU2713415.1 transporter substrate-binding domain-containing protein [Zooshikella harenae]
MCLLLTVNAILQANEVQKVKPLTIATLEYPPYHYVNSHGKIDGITVSLVNHVFNTMQQPVVIRILPWSRLLKSLKEGIVDGAFQVLYKEERTHYLDYSQEVLMQEVVTLFIKQGHKINYSGDLSLLANYRLGVRQDFSYGPVFDHLVTEGVFTKLTSKTRPRELIIMLERGDIDVLVGDLFSIPYQHRQITYETPLHNFERLQPDVQVTPSFMVFSKVKELKNVREQFDITLQQMKKQGQYQSYIDSWSQ